MQGSGVKTCSTSIGFRPVLHCMLAWRDLGANCFVIGIVCIQVMRITPRLNESINEEWLSDKGRFSYDGLKRQRLNIPLVKTSEGFTTVLWPDALKAVAEGLKGVKGNEMKAIAGKLADAEAMVALKVTGITLASQGLLPFTFACCSMLWHSCGFAQEFCIDCTADAGTVNLGWLHR